MLFRIERACIDDVSPIFNIERACFDKSDMHPVKVLRPLVTGSNFGVIVAHNDDDDDNGDDDDDGDDGKRKIDDKPPMRMIVGYISVIDPSQSSSFEWRFRGLDTDPQVSTIANLAVHPAFRRRGLGRRLMHWALEVARAHPTCKMIGLHARPENTSAIAMYTSMGFTMSRIIPDYYDEDEDGVWMSKSLDG
jgi:ribosomal protein S18 acetylase RimI-like enzyme